MGPSMTVMIFETRIIEAERGDFKDPMSEWQAFDLVESHHENSHMQATPLSQLAMQRINSDSKHKPSWGVTE